jgi:transcriptional regulator with XRE-family HTH domain
MVNPVALKIRAKKLGVLVRDARLEAGRSVEECAQAIGISPETFEAYEFGEKSPSLPELEQIASMFGVSFDNFRKDRLLAKEEASGRDKKSARTIRLRHRMIGALLRQARLEAGLSAEALAEKSWTSAKLVESYELGEIPVPLPDLEILSEALGKPLEHFREGNGPVLLSAAQQNQVQEFLALPPELQDFVCKPVNRPYLEVAQRLSEMDVHKLRAIAEGILEITL